MTTPIVPVNTYGASLAVPADGESVSSASVIGYVQEIANRIEFLRQRVPGANPLATPMKLNLNPADAAILPGSTQWVKSFSSTLVPVVNNAVLGTEVFIFPFRLTPGQVIKKCGIQLRGAPAHAAMPAVRPNINLCQLDLAAQIGLAAQPAFTVLTGITDATGTTAAYQLNHWLETGTLTFTVGADELYALRITGESGANALVGLQILGAYVSVSAP